MANVKTPKLFASDLSNYAEIRRGLSSTMRKLTVSKSDLKKLTPDVQQAYIRQLTRRRASAPRCFRPVDQITTEVRTKLKRKSYLRPPVLSSKPCRQRWLTGK